VSRWLAALHELGVRTLVLTNASGSLRPGVGPGSLVLIEDHINLQGLNPLAGAEGGPQFIDLAAAYDPGLCAVLRAAAERVGVELEAGVYLAVLGPSFETPAEIRAFRALGADLVGMSTVPEVIAARALRMRVAAVSVVTNLAAGMASEPLSHEQTLAASNRAAGDLARLLVGACRRSRVARTDLNELVSGRRRHGRRGARRARDRARGSHESSGRRDRARNRGALPTGGLGRDGRGLRLRPRTSPPPATRSRVRPCGWPRWQTSRTGAMTSRPRWRRRRRRWPTARTRSTSWPRSRPSWRATSASSASWCRPAARRSGPATTLKVILETGLLETPSGSPPRPGSRLWPGRTFSRPRPARRRWAHAPGVALLLAVIAEAGGRVGFKAAGGIRTGADAAGYLLLADGIVGPGWASPATFRLGASALLDDLLRITGHGTGEGVVDGDRY
jgi:inosine/guanosine/xanthosine phosphorylase family protein